MGPIGIRTGAGEAAVDLRFMNNHETLNYSPHLVRSGLRWLEVVGGRLFGSWSDLRWLVEVVWSGLVWLEVVWCGWKLLVEVIWSGLKWLVEVVWRGLKWFEMLWSGFMKVGFYSINGELERRSPSYFPSERGLGKRGREPSHPQWASKPLVSHGSNIISHQSNGRQQLKNKIWGNN